MKKLLDGKNNPNIWKKEYTCTGVGFNQEGKIPCYSLWEVTATDIYQRVSYAYRCTSTCYGFICPECGCFTEINSVDLPIEVRNSARRYNL